MLRVGLTGGIGSGKSTVAQRFSMLGAVVIDADVLAREVVAPGSPGLKAIVDRFGEGVLDDEGSLNRPALGAIVFADGRSRRDLEGITHPLIARRTAELVAAAADDAIIVHDVPLLVEKHYGPGYHLVMVVGAGAETRVKRLMHTRGMTEADARSRIASQATDQERRDAADVWLDNEGRKDDLLAAGRRALARAAGAVRGERPQRHPFAAPGAARAPRPGPHVAGSGRAVAGATASRVRRRPRHRRPRGQHRRARTRREGRHRPPARRQHPGWTSTIPAVLERLRQAGFPLAEGVWSDFDSGSQGEWPKRMLGSSDPARVAHIHVREVDSEGWRWALMFRDWMRADATARAEYAAEKHRLAATTSSVSEYADAKEPWFDSVHDRVRAWAEATGWQPPNG